MRPSLSSAAKWVWLYATKRQTGAAADVALVAAPGAGKRLAIHKIIIGSLSTAESVQITEGADGATTRIYDQSLTAGTNVILEWPFEAPMILGDNVALNLTTDAGNCRINVHYAVGY